MPKFIHMYGASHNNLRNLDVNIEHGALTVITGVSGSGKSSLAFDTLYAEGQRRYIETFSPYARQFLERMQRPALKHIEGVLPAIALEQHNPVRSSRATVGTMTELSEYFKLLFARAAKLFCGNCAKPVQLEHQESIWQQLTDYCALHIQPLLVFSFKLTFPERLTDIEIDHFLSMGGYTRVLARKRDESMAEVEVIQDRARFHEENRSRIMQALEAALAAGKGRIAVHLLDQGAVQHTWQFSKAWHCASCNISYRPPALALFSFNSALGACEHCRGFGRVIGIDLNLVIPNPSLSLCQGALKPFQSKSFYECQTDLERHAAAFDIRLDISWEALSERERQWVINGAPQYRTSKDWNKHWYGVRGFFNWLESRSYKMHVRVMLSKYRSYTTCTHCMGARLSTEALLWRIAEEPVSKLSYQKKFHPQGGTWLESVIPPGFNLHDFNLMPLSDLRLYFQELCLDHLSAKACDILLKEIRLRLNYLCDVGLSYLTLDRQARTLSGGEVQRINLTTALGTSLTETLFVLDEPSIGLHANDIQKLVSMLKRLRDAGNTLVVVEHDPQVIQYADHIIELGVGAGEQGGSIVFDAAYAKLADAHTLTAQYLNGKKRIMRPPAFPLTHAQRAIELKAASLHNVKSVDLRVPLNALVGIAGVSGSGKSTLIVDLLYPALLRATGAQRRGAQITEEQNIGNNTLTPGQWQALCGASALDTVVLLDQSPLSKSPRSNPLSVVGGFDILRQVFAALPEAKNKGFSTSHFSFNTDAGRCSLCSGSGFEHIEMQFLSDVYLPCPNCQGKRYRDEVLSVTLPSPWGELSIAKVLDLTVSQALTLFATQKTLVKSLQALEAVGLAYIRLGQPTTTLSGGEAQRLKIAAQLAKPTVLPTAKKKILFILDEPTTGLHFEDIQQLLKALQHLLDQGHSIVMIEHNLDVLAVCDWVIELGPAGGEQGGNIVFQGNVQALLTEKTVTAQALRTYFSASAYRVAESTTALSALALKDTPNLLIQGAHEHNLKGFDLEIPRHQFTVISGVSGSGKSTLAFDIIFKEGQRRYLESINAYARQFVQPATRPQVDAIYGLSPTVAIEQRASRAGQKSTVATLTEIYHYLRLIYAKVGQVHCPSCHIPIAAQTRAQMCHNIFSQHQGEHIGILAPLVIARKGHYKPLARWAFTQGFSHLRVDGDFLPCADWPELDRFRKHTVELPIGDLHIGAHSVAELDGLLTRALQLGKGVVYVLYPLQHLHHHVQQNRWSATDKMHSLMLSQHQACPRCQQSFPELDPRHFSFNASSGWCPSCHGLGINSKEHTSDAGNLLHTRFSVLDADLPPCQACQGTRLNPFARSVKFRQYTIDAFSALTIDEAINVMQSWHLDFRESAIVEHAYTEILSRLEFLRHVGLNYLNLNRAAPSLSGGEAQRIRLAAQLGSALCGVCYVLDEPTIGLHAHDLHILLDSLKDLSKKGNSVIVVEHDEATIRSADFIVDMGPAAGKQGGNIVVSGQLSTLLNCPNSLTAQALLRDPLTISPSMVTEHTPFLQLKGCNANNLKHIDISIPIGKLSIITGVSGTGKTSLSRQVLLASLLQTCRTQSEQAIACQSISGWEHISKAVEITQDPIGKTSRSCPATYVGIWDEIRANFAQTHEAKLRGYRASRFSFNQSQGRCSRCDGQGYVTVTMNFLPDVEEQCDSCLGLRFNRETLEVCWLGFHAGDWLQMTVSQALPLVTVHHKIQQKLRLLEEIGLGYLQLGQPSPTLSGGEAQRLKIVAELGQTTSIPCLYLLDEPSVGLHMLDVEKLATMLKRLTQQGHTLVLVEHNLDLVALADWVIDLGPSGGEQGGELMFAGSVNALCSQNSKTARALQQHLHQRA